MALTKISEGGFKDDAASQAKIADEAVDEARLQISNAGSNGQFLQKQSGNTGGLTWAAANEYTHPNHSGEVTSTADGAQVIASEVVDEDNLKISNAGTNGQFLQKQSGNTGGLTWADAGGGVDSDAQDNTVAGTNAGDSFTGTDAINNTLFGKNAGTAITTGDSNTLFGRNSGLSITTGSSNLVVGNYSLGACTTGSNNIGIGEQCLTGDLTTASFNVAIGNRAGYGVTSGEKCVFLGDYSGYNSTTGHGNIGIGDQTMGQAAAVTGHYNIGIGTRAFKGDGGAISGNYNIAIGGKAAQRQHSSVTENISIGMEAGRGGTSEGLYGGYNVFIGSYAGHVLESGQINTCVGRSAGASVTTGGSNLLLGYNAGQSTSPSGQITTQSNLICLGNSSITDIYCNDTSISSSDKRDKTDITDFTHGLNWINKLKPVTYRWDRRDWYNEYNEDGSLKKEVTPDGSKKKARQHIGFLAQDVLAIEQADGFASKKDDMLVVNLNADDTAYGLKYERLVPVLVNAIKELSAKVETLETKVAALESA